MWIERTEEFTAPEKDADTYLEQLEKKYNIKSIYIRRSWLETVDVTVIYEVNMDKIVTVNWKEKEN